MKYLVMECGLSYAIVLDEQGRFLKTANLNYQVGQQLDHIVPLQTEKRKILRLRNAVALAAAACICLISVLAFQFILSPVGTVRISINPDVAMHVNRMHYVVGLEGLNDDGKDLIQGVDYSWKKVEQVSDELADRAMEQGYLSQGGKIRLSVESEDKEWKTAAEEMVLTELKVHLEEEIVIVVGDDDDDHDDDDDDHDDDEQQNKPPKATASPSPKPQGGGSSSTSQQNSSRIENDDDDDDDHDDDDDDDRDDKDDDDDDDRDDEKPKATIKPTVKPTPRPTPSSSKDDDDDDDHEDDHSDDDSDDNDDDDDD